MKRIKQIKKEINKFTKDLLEKYPELESVNIDCCYGYDNCDNSLNVSVFEMQDTE